MSRCASCGEEKPLIRVATERGERARVCTECYRAKYRDWKVMH